MSELADILNAPTSVPYRGKDYPLREMTFAERAVFSRRIERRAEEMLGRSFGRMPREAWDAWAKAVGADIAAGTYEYGGEAYLRALQCVDGWAYSIHLVLKAEHPECTEDFCREMVTELVGEKLIEQMTKVEAVGADPGNSSAPAGRSAPPGTCSPSSPTTLSGSRRKKSRK